MNKNILIVEDDEDIAKNLALLLDGEGYQVTLAKNGKLALDHLQSTDVLPSLILLDLMMPVMDGFQFREHQEQHPEFNLIPVVIMTADGNVEMKKKKIKAQDFVKKPIDIDHFLDIVQRYSL